MATNNIINNKNPNLMFAFSSASPYATATGDGTRVIAEWDTSIVGTIHTANQWFATVAGYYLIGWNIYLTGLTASHVTGVTTLSLPGSGWGIEVDTNPYNLSDSGMATLSNKCICQLNVNDPIWIYVTVSGGTKVVDIGGNINSALFYGLLIA